MSSTRVKTSRHVRGEEEIEHRTPSKVLDDQRVEGELSSDIEEDPSSRCLVTNESRSKSVKEDLESAVNGADT